MSTSTSATTRLAELLPETKQVHGPARLLKPTTNPVPLLNNTLATTYTHIHTAQLSLYYYLRASALVTNPLETLLQDLIPLTLSQCFFCALCLPAVGSWNSGTEINNAGTPTKSGKGTGSSVGTPSRKRPGGKSAGNPSSVNAENPPWQTRITPTMISLILTFILPPIPLMVLALALGAPLYPTSLLPHTLALSVHVSLLAAMPIFYTHGVNANAWRDISAAWLPFDEAGVWGGTVGAFVGGWIGAVPMALDWDREWQKWPCTVLWGAVGGWASGRVVTGRGLGWGMGRRIDLGVAVEGQATHIEDEQKKTT